MNSRCFKISQNISNITNYFKIFQKISNQFKKVSKYFKLIQNIFLNEFITTL